MRSQSGRDDNSTAPEPNNQPPFHTVERHPRTGPNRFFAEVYTLAILALLYSHAQTLPHKLSGCALFVVNNTLKTSKSFREEEFPGLDVFICTADPYKEPPIGVVNTALSLMAYDYPTEKISVYVSDDAGSAFTLFAFIEAAKFASYWLPFCRENDIMDRSPHVYFSSVHSTNSDTDKIKEMYESMKAKVENVMNREVSEIYINDDEEREVFNKWKSGFTPQDHPTVIQVLLDSRHNNDITGHFLPNLIYVSRQKSMTSPHHFKAGALNVLLRVSTIMTNAPLILTQDCDMYSNDPTTPLRILCYVYDLAIQPTLGFIQFPQRFQGLNKDTYGYEFKHIIRLHPRGADGLGGAYYFGTGTFFRRRALGDPSACVETGIPELSPDYVVKKHIKSPDVLALAHGVASCNYEIQTQWGSKMGFRYGSLVEDLFTGYQMHSEGWRSIFCDPERAAFLGNAPINLVDALYQWKRWGVGLLEIGLGYSCYIFWTILSIPTTIYAFLPQLALFNGVTVFPKMYEPWFLLHVFLFIGAYGQDFIEYVIEGSSFRKWWSSQRMWMIRNLSSFAFATAECLLKSTGLSSYGFIVTSKVVDDEQYKRYYRGMWEIGVPSTLLVPPTTAAIINLLSFIWGAVLIFSGGRDVGESLVLQMVLAGCIVLNCLPIYEAIALRSDHGKMPTKLPSFQHLSQGLLCCNFHIFQW
ncbi:putative Cellulose synthase like G3 [Hibiscus syriacus]|uniref:Cellulose synthase like G3 n=1 Tax=Hibiscus syriacus TaxID=106335 RepID=A0A6A3BP09_HIBSY|nr:putative Cellulose synthase like G3 [Hibiscus syriacus]